MRPKLHHLPIILGLLAVLISIPATVYLVRQKQELRKRAEEIPLNFTLNPNHPRLLIDATESAQIRNKITSQPWARTMFNYIKAQANCWVNTGMPCQPSPAPTPNCGTPTPGIPREAAISWRYLCPEAAGSAKGTALDYTRSTADSHFCVANQTCYPGNTPVYNLTPPPNAQTVTLKDVWNSTTHNRYADGLLHLGLTYQLSTESDSVKLRYAQKAKEILLDYATLYPTLRLHDNVGRFEPYAATGSGKIMAETIHEAIWGVKAAQAYDLVYDSGVFTADDKARIETNLFRKMINDTIYLSTRNSRNNHQSWYNSVIGTVGFLLNDTGLINVALNGRTAPDGREIWGFKKQICEIMDNDGFWPEGTGYHHVVMDAYTPLAEAARHADMDLYRLDVSSACDNPPPTLKNFKMMFEMVEKLILPNGYVPTLEDGGAIWGAANTNFYDLAYTRFGGDFYAWLVNKVNPRRYSIYSLLYGQPTLPTPTPALSSKVLKDVGYGVLRTGAGSGTSYALLDFGPFRSHSHFDKLNFIYYSNGQIPLPDLGTVAYGSPYAQRTPDKGWYPYPLAHNTFVVDGGTQAQVPGTLLYCSFNPGSDPISPCIDRNDPNFKVIQAKVDNAYPDTTAKRMLALNQDYLIDSLEVSGSDNQRHTFDLPFHGNILDTSGHITNNSLTTNLPLSDGNTICRLNDGSLACNQYGCQYLEATKSATLTQNIASFSAQWQEITNPASQTVQEAKTLEAFGEIEGIADLVNPSLSAEVKATTTLNNLRFQVNGLNPTSGDEVFSVVGPFPPLGNTKPFLIWRKHGRNAKFISVIESYTEGQRKISNATLTQNAQGQDIVTVNFVNGRRDTFNLTTMTGSVITPTPTPTVIPSPTPTPTPTVTPTITITPTLTPTLTPIPGGASLSFKIKFQGVGVQRGNKQVRVTLKNGQVFNSVLVTSDSQGVYSGSINSITPGTYEVLVKGPSHLQKNFGSVTFTAGQTTTKDWSSFSLLAGDFNGDNRISIEDLGLILSAYTQLSVPIPPGNPVYDVNFDNVISIEDVSLPLANYTNLSVPGDN